MFFPISVDALERENNQLKLTIDQKNIDISILQSKYNDSAMR